MIVAFLHPQRHLLTRRARGVDETLRLQLALQKLIGRTLIDQDVRADGCLRDELGRVVALPRAAIAAEIRRERLLAPRHLRRRDDR